MNFSWYNNPRNEEITDRVTEKRFDTEWTISDLYMEYNSKPGLEAHLNIVKPILDNAPDLPTGQMIYESSKNTYLGVVPRIDSEFTEVQVSEWITVNTSQSSEFISMTRIIPSRSQASSILIQNSRLTGTVYKVFKEI